MSKLILKHRINRFYKIFGDYIGSNQTATLADLKSHDFLLGVQFDIYEALDNSSIDPMNIWLTKLLNNINNIIL